MTRAAILAKIAELEQKLRAAKTDDGKHYYALCLAGWRKMLEKAP